MPKRRISVWISLVVTLLVAIFLTFDIVVGLSYSFKIIYKALLGIFILLNVVNGFNTFKDMRKKNIQE